MDNKLPYVSMQQLNLIYPSIKEKLFNVDNTDCQDLMKLIKYDTKNPYISSSLTIIDMIDLISPESSTQRVFDDRLGANIIGEAKTELRFSISAKPVQSYYLTDITIGFEVVTHYSINSIYSKTLYSNEPFPQYNRKREICILINKILSGENVNGIGVLKPTVSYIERVVLPDTEWLDSTFGFSIMGQ